MPTDAFFILHHDLPRQGPGSDKATREAIRRLPPLPQSPVILDLGCGPGRHTLVLAKRFNVRVTAIDVHQPFLDQLGRSAQAAGLSELIVTRRASMTALECPPESVDLIWCEGAIYIVGFQAGLRLWRPLLQPRGLAVISECSWLTADPPAEAAAFFKAAYPDMAGVEQNIARATAEGYDVFDYFLLPQRAWWDEYYMPLQERMALLRPQATGNPELAAVLAETEGEITVFSRFGDSYGYVFYLMRKGDRDPFGKA